jgi:hypothetical protein
MDRARDRGGVTSVKDWEAVVAAATALPGVEQATSYGKPALRFRGRTIAGTTAPDPGSFVLFVAVEEKDLLIERDPATFWQTDHYRDWPAVLVRYGSGSDELLTTLLSRAWWDRATVAQRRSFGARP